MTSTFHGLETAKRGMFTHQSALHTTGHNISNASTPGYSRQRVNFETTLPYPKPAMNRPQIPGQMGTGVEAGSIQRVREGFLDHQFRAENNKSGYYESRSKALSRLEEIMNEPSDTGLSTNMDQFWQSIEDLSAHPENSGSRSTVRQRAIAVVDTFHHLHDSLTQVREETSRQIDIAVKEVNAITDQIEKLNKQIGDIEPHGYLPNDLYDKRDLLVDQLSKLVNVKVTTVPSGGLAKDIAVGKYQIDIVNETGTAVLANVVDTKNGARQIAYNKNDTAVTFLKEDGSTLNLSFKGELQGLAEAYNDIYPGMIDNLNNMAYHFSMEFNNIHEDGYGLDNNNTPSQNTGKLFFSQLTNKQDAAKLIDLHDHIKSNLNNIAASQSGYAGDNENALALADVRYNSVIIDGDSTTLENYYVSLIGEMGVNAQSANQLLDTADTLKLAVEERKQAVSGVSLDEEMTNMIKFQHAYNASARNITMVDEMLDRIINGLGVGGR